MRSAQLQVMGEFAQLERALIRDRQREGIEARMAARPVNPVSDAPARGTDRCQGCADARAPCADEGAVDRGDRDRDGRMQDAVPRAGVAAQPGEQRLQDPEDDECDGARRRCRVLGA